MQIDKQNNLQIQCVHALYLTCFDWLREDRFCGFFFEKNVPKNEPTEIILQTILFQKITNLIFEIYFSLKANVINHCLKIDKKNNFYFVNKS